LWRDNSVDYTLIDANWADTHTSMQHNSTRDYEAQIMRGL